MGDREQLAVSAPIELSVIRTVCPVPSARTELIRTVFPVPRARIKLIRTVFPLPSACIELSVFRTVFPVPSARALEFSDSSMGKEDRVEEAAKNQFFSASRHLGQAICNNFPALCPRTRKNTQNKTKLLLALHKDKAKKSAECIYSF